MITKLGLKKCIIYGVYNGDKGIDNIVREKDP